jgi:hypothetical protein
MGFCELSLLLGDTTGAGLFNDCVIFIIEVVSFFALVVTLILFVKPSITKVHHRFSCTNHESEAIGDTEIHKSTLSEPLKAPDKDSAESRQQSGRSTCFLVLSLVCILQIISIAFTITFSIIGGIGECSQTSSLMALSCSILGWIICGLHAFIYRNYISGNNVKPLSTYNLTSEDRSRTMTVISIIFIGWGSASTVTHALLCIQYFDTAENISLSCILVVTVTISVLWTLSWSVLLAHHECRYRNDDHISIFLKTNSKSSDHVENETLSSLWASHKTSPVRNAWTLEAQDTMVDIRLSDSGNESRSNMTSESSVVIKKITLDADGTLHFPSSSPSANSMSVSGSLRHLSTLSTSWSSVTSKLLKEQSIVNVEIEITVVSWEVLFVNQKPVIVYSLALTESQAGRPSNHDPSASKSSKIIQKRLDELIYMREKLLSDYPNAQDLPSVPIFSHQELEYLIAETRLSGKNLLKENDPLYETHREAMTRYLEDLVAHPHISRSLIQDLRSSTLMMRSSSINSTSPSTKATSSSQSLLTRSLNLAANPTSNPYPLFLHNERSLVVTVRGWLDLASKPSSSTSAVSKIFYEVEVQYGEHSHILHKRFRQFRALYQALDAQGLTSLSQSDESSSSFMIQGPFKYSLRRSRMTPTSKEDEHKVSLSTAVSTV